jgi:hypothetical protein
VRFWEDIWLGNTPLADQYLSLCNTVQRKNVLVAYVLSHIPLNIEFWRVLNGNKWNDWLNLCQRLMTVNLSNRQDKFVWKLTKSGVFTVKSMYVDLMNEDVQFLHKFLWKLKLPLNIKIFMWFIHGKVLLTKDNLVKHKWKGCTKCCFCDSKETVQHLFISCPFIVLFGAWYTSHIIYHH